MSVRLDVFDDDIRRPKRGTTKSRKAAQTLAPETDEMVKQFLALWGKCYQKIVGKAYVATKDEIDALRDFLTVLQEQERTVWQTNLFADCLQRVQDYFDYFHLMPQAQLYAFRYRVPFAPTIHMFLADYNHIPVAKKGKFGVYTVEQDGWEPYIRG